MSNQFNQQNNNNGDGGGFARQQQQQDPATLELLQRLAYEAQARNGEMMHQRQQPQPQQQSHQQQPYQPMGAQPQSAPAYPSQSQATTTQPPQPRTRKAKRRSRNRNSSNSNKGAATALNANYNNYPTSTGATNQNQNNNSNNNTNHGGGSAGSANAAVPPAAPNQPVMPQIPPGYFMPEAPRTLKERWEQIKIAFGAKSTTDQSNDYNSLLKAQKPMKFLKGVSVWTNFGGAFFAIVCSVAAWLYGASSSVDWLREQTWGKFVDGDFWNVAIWPLLLLATFYIIACTPLSWPETPDEWISDVVWFSIFAADVITNMHRINEWLPTFVLPGSNETIKWTWVIPVLVVVLSGVISYFPERVFWAQVQRLGQLRLQLAYQKLVKEYLKYQENLRLQMVYQKLVGGNGRGQ